MKYADCSPVCYPCVETKQDPSLSKPGGDYARNRPGLSRNGTARICKCGHASCPRTKAVA